MFGELVEEFGGGKGVGADGVEAGVFDAGEFGFRIWGLIGGERAVGDGTKEGAVAIYREESSVKSQGHRDLDTRWGEIFTPDC